MPASDAGRSTVTIVAAARTRAARRRGRRDDRDDADRHREHDAAGAARRRRATTPRHDHEQRRSATHGRVAQREARRAPSRSTSAWISGPGIRPSRSSTCGGGPAATLRSRRRRRSCRAPPRRVNLSFVHVDEAEVVERVRRPGVVDPCAGRRRAPGPDVPGTARRPRCGNSRHALDARSPCGGRLPSGSSITLRPPGTPRLYSRPLPNRSICASCRRAPRRSSTARHSPRGRGPPRSALRPASSFGARLGELDVVGDHARPGLRRGCG